MPEKNKYDALKSYASTAKGVASTFFRGSAGSGSERDIDYGPGPKPATAKPPQPPSDWYRSYGRYAPKGSDKKNARRRGTKS